MAWNQIGVLEVKIPNHNNNLNKSVCVCVCVYVCMREISERVNKKNGKSYGTDFFDIVPTKLWQSP